MRAFTRLPYKDQIETPVSAQSPADTVPVSNPQDAGTTLLGSAPSGAKARQVVDGTAIPFTQYLLPHGRRRDELIDRTPEIGALAQCFIDAGGRYEMELLGDYLTVSLTATYDTPEDGWQDIEIELVPNGPGVGEAVDRLVTKSVAFLSKLKGSK